MDVKRSEAAYVNLKARGYLIYSNRNFFKLTTATEECYINYCMDPDIFNEKIDYVIENHCDLLTFPCSDIELKNVSHFSILHI